MRTTTRFVRPVAIGAGLAVLVPAAIAFAPAASASVTTDTGDSSSTATVLSLGALGHKVQAVVATLSASTITKPATAAIDLVPVNLDGTKIAEQKVSNKTQTVGSQNHSVAGAVGIVTPAINLSASTANGPVAKLTSAGSITPSLLGLTFAQVSSTLSFGSSVVSKTADASKAVTVKNFALPSLKSLLGRLGLNIDLLSTSKLEELVNKLNLATSSITKAEAAAAAIPAATTTVANKTTALDDAIAAAPFSNVAVTTVLTTLGVAAPTNAADWQNLTAPEQSAIVTALNGVTAGSGTAINTANTALKAAQNALAALQAIVANLPSLLDNALDTPLLSIGNITIGTIADAGAKHAAKVTGTVQGLSVLGNQLVKSTDLVNLGSSTLASVQSKINTLTSTLSSVLTGSALSGFLGTLTVPAPKISLLQKTTSLSPIGGYQAAAAGVIGAAVSWGALSIPATAIPSVARPNVSIVNGLAVSDPISVTVATLTDASRYAPASAPGSTTVTPSKNTPGLASTGVSTGVAIGALLLMIAAYGVRRFRLRPVME